MNIVAVYALVTLFFLLLLLLLLYWLHLLDSILFLQLSLLQPFLLSAAQLLVGIRSLQCQLRTECWLSLLFCFPPRTRLDSLFVIAFSTHDLSALFRSLVEVNQAN